MIVIKFLFTFVITAPKEFLFVSNSKTPQSQFG